MIDKCICGVCGCQEYNVMGRWRHGKDVQIAGIPVCLEDDQYEIRRCRNCDFRWKSPQLSYNEYLNYYAMSTMDDWNLDETKIGNRRLQQKQQIIEGLVRGGRVIDIGCWKGDFLRGWSGGWKKFGIEPSIAGREICNNMGIQIIGTAIEDITTSDISFDVISMMDLIEHLPDPFEQMRPVIDCLKPGGVLVIETGNADSIVARVMRIDWHYYTALEHISFFCDHSLGKLLSRLSVRVHGIWHWPHMVLGRQHNLKQWYTALSFKWPIIRPRHLVRSIVRQGQFPKKEGGSPWLTGVSDHVFLIGLKGGEQYLNGHKRTNTSYYSD